ncbi:MAG TPA: sigma-70 family RNA polymerase sigma factor [Nitrosopumilaceae archaeon]|jgi:RNA polymerase sigma factor (sigma-70 family)|nr:sigma-70 family RNA polymerase sigma factor [Nitrosopumilaceae archaeon]
MSKRQFTDSEFIQGLKSNDDVIMTALYKKYFGVILKHILNNSGTEEEAQDIYQESIIVLYQNVQKTSFTLNCALQTYIYSVARRLWLKQLNKNAHVYKLDDKFSYDDEPADISSEVLEHEQRELQIMKMAESLEALGEPCKTLIQDFYVNQLSMEDIAEKFGYTNAYNAKNQKYKCLQRLKRLFFIQPLPEIEESSGRHD